jgi:hypothetical protein
MDMCQSCQGKYDIGHLSVISNVFFLTNFIIFLVGKRELQINSSLNLTNFSYFWKFLLVLNSSKLKKKNKNTSDNVHIIFFVKFKHM